MPVTASQLFEMDCFCNYFAVHVSGWTIAIPEIANAGFDFWDISNGNFCRMNSELLHANEGQLNKQKTTPYLTCPACNSKVAHGTKRKGIVESLILYPLGFRAYRCEYCYKRFCSRTKQYLTSQEK